MANPTAFTVALLAMFLLLNVVTYGRKTQSSKEAAVDIVPGKELTEDEDNILLFNPIDIPSPFRSYDLNKDGVVTLIELAKVTDTNIEDARGAFRSADSDHDNKLNYKEFSKAPWIFRANDATDEDMSSFDENELQ